MDLKCASCKYITYDIGGSECCYQICKNYSGFEYGLNRIGLGMIRKYLVENIFRNPDIMFSLTESRGEIDLCDVIASLYELLHREVEGEPYEYMFHWANKVGSGVNDDLFKGE